MTTTQKYIIATIHIPIEIHTNQFIPLNERCRIGFEYRENLEEFPINNSFDQQELISAFTQFFTPTPTPPVVYHRRNPGQQKTFKVNPTTRRRVLFTAKNRDTVLKLIEN